MAYQPNQNPTWVERDSLDPNDSRRIIQGADFGSEFDNIKSEFDSISGELTGLKGDLDNLVEDALPNGNVASCYYSPGYTPGADGVEGFIYKFNIDRVEAAGSPELPQTYVYFSEEFTDVDLNGTPSHFAFNFSVIDGSGSPVIHKVSSARANYVGFIAWKLSAEGAWVPLPSLEVAFTLIVVDMDKGHS